ncbi:hypothetical protein CVT25_000683 [Psilocybe cyanescens]|uniref:Uncharacterized protein n=1 Tax=Psilocybe cyanescens TaxID=93625 RepID=A0A409XU69_PSICY|nr:hypothetical protein CVT25_000683 [Psilocybe cyanescens]
MLFPTQPLASRKLSLAMTDVTYPLFPITAFLGFILPLIPLRWHLQALNSGTCYFIFWSSLACLNQFINSIVWADNAINLSPAWCEISIRIMMAASVGVPASSLCINRRLYLISSVRAASISVAEKRRAVLIDSLICFLFPLIYVALQYVVQGHRFNIFEEIGCYPVLYNTLLTFFISSMWPLVLGLISMVYCILSLRSFARRRLEFNQFISMNSSLTVSRYFRLMGLAMTEICATTPLSIFIIWLNATASPIGPWRSWSDTHFNYSRVEQFPSVLWRSNHLLTVAMEFSRWITPVCSFTFFAFFGFAHESMKNYCLAWKWMKALFGFSPSSPGHTAKASKQSSPITRQKVVSAHIPTFSLPLHSLQRTDTRDSILSKADGDTTSYVDSFPSSPVSSTVLGSPALTKPAKPLHADIWSTSVQSISLSRSRTL